MCDCDIITVKLCFIFLNFNVQCGRTVLMVAALQTDGAANVRALLSQEGVLVELKNNVSYEVCIKIP